MSHPEKLIRRTLYQIHVDKWKDCTACGLHECRTKIVLARGKIPCDVLLCGEGPGHSEDVIGQPFVGPAGYLLNDIISKAIEPNIRCAFTNVVCCIPLDEEGVKVEAPPNECIKACSPRLQEFIAIAKPKLVVCVGGVAASALRKQRTQLGLADVPLVDITHPAAILRANQAQQSLAVQRCIVVLANAVEAMYQA